MHTECALFAHSSTRKCADYAHDIFRPFVQAMHMSIVQTDWLKSRKKEQRATDQMIADAAGIDRSVINKLLVGKVQFNAKYADAFARALDISRNEVLYRFGVIAELDEAPAAPVSINLPFLLPNGAALTTMFRSMLDLAGEPADQDELAQMLAQSFPGAFQAAVSAQASQDGDEAHTPSTLSRAAAASLPST